MTETTKKTPVKKATTAKKTTAKKKVDLSESVVVLSTSVGENLVIRANPSDDAVRGFVTEQSARFTSGQAGGPSGIPAYQIYGAARFVTELSWIEGDQPIEAIDISDIIPA